MNQKLPFHELAELYAEVCGVSHENAESFLKLFFEALSECIINGQDVTIKGVGSFTRSDNADNPVAFEPAPELARSINAPFALFEPEVLAPDATDEALDAVALEPLPEPEPEPIPEPEPEPEPEEVVEEEVSEAESHPTTDDEAAEDESIAESVLSEEEAEAEPEVETETVSEAETEQTVEPEASVEEPAEEVVSQEESHEEVVNDDTEPEPVPEVEQTVRAAETVITEEPKPIEEPAPEPKSEPEPAPVTPRPSYKYGTIPSKPAEIAEDEEERVATTERRRHHRRRSSIHSHESHSSNSGFGLGFFAGLIVGLAIGACSVYFAIDYLFPNRSAAVEEDMIEVIEEQPATPVADTISSVDTVATPPAAPAPQPVAEPAPAAAPAAEAKAKAPVVDVIAKGYLLNDMAKKHFGNKAFWVYIYEENKAKIKNPNAMQPGDKLVIPDAAKYGIDASNPASVKAANDMAGKILSRFPR